MAGSKVFKDFVEDLSCFVEDIGDGIYTDRKILQSELFSLVDDYYDKVYIKNGVDVYLQYILEKATESYHGINSIDEIFEIVYQVWKEGYMLAYPNDKLFAE